MVVVSSDKGLCGSFNTDLLRAVEKDLSAERWPDVELAVVGRKASDYFRRRQWNLVIDERETMSSPRPPRTARGSGSMFIKAFTSGEVDSVWLVYNSFVNMIRQDTLSSACCRSSRPRSKDEADESRSTISTSPTRRPFSQSCFRGTSRPRSRRALFDSAAAEQAARMTSMDTATRNAGDMIDALTMLYNRTRQAAITKELIEIVSGAQALEG